MSEEANKSSPKECERKFIVIGDDWKRDSIAEQHLVQGTFRLTGKFRVRVRIIDGTKVEIAFKGPKKKSSKKRKTRTTRKGLSRVELLADATFVKGTPEMAIRMCNAGVVVKTRHTIRHGMNPSWILYVDVYDSGKVLAELETEELDDDFCLRCIPGLPEWLGREVTGDYEYSNDYLARLTKTAI